MTILDNGSMIPLTPITEAIIRALVNLQPDLGRQGQGVAMVNFAAGGVHVVLLRKNTAAEAWVKVTNAS